MTLGNEPAILIYQKEKKDNYRLKFFSEEESRGCLKDVVEEGRARYPSRYSCHPLLLPTHPAFVIPFSEQH